MASVINFEVLSFLRDGRPFPVGSWFLVEGRFLPRQLTDKLRPVVYAKADDDGLAIVYPRSASRKGGFVHLAHDGHDCSTTASGCQQRIHGCHINKPGQVDLRTPITLKVDLLKVRQMCFEDEGSALLHELEREPE